MGASPRCVYRLRHHGAAAPGPRAVQALRRSLALPRLILEPVHQLVVLLVAADPEPHNVLTFAATERPVVVGDADRVYRLRGVHLLEGMMPGGVERVLERHSATGGVQAG